jgi:transposase
MNTKTYYVMAIDIAKNKSDFFIQGLHSEVLMEPTTYKHNLKNFMQLKKFLLDNNLKNDITIMMESTSSYHYPVERFFNEHGFKVIVVNPNLVKKSDTSFRKTKTDKIDCFKIAECYFKAEIKSNALKSLNIYDDLTTLNRQYLSLEKAITALKNRYTRLLDICIPEYEIFFLTSKNTIDTSKKYLYKYLNLFYQFPHSEIIANTRVDKLANTLNSAYNWNYIERMTKESIEIKNISKNSYPGVSKYSEEVFNLKQIIRLLITNLKEQSTIASKLIILAKKTKYFKNINSIYGIGELTTAQIIAELKDIDRFNSYKQINAYLGLEPSIYQSGKAYYNGKITKSGNSCGRKVLYTVVKNITNISSKGFANHPILLHYLKKKEKENKTEKESVISTTTKLIRIIFSLCKNNSEFNIK